MAIKTAAEIIRKGVERAQVTYDAADPNPLIWLKDWLRSVSLGFPWPEVEGVVPATLNVGEYILEMGRSASVAPDVYIHRVNFPLLQVYNDCVPNSILQQAFDSTLISYPARVPEGLPTRAAYQRDWEEPGRVAIIFNKKAKENLALEIKYQFDPAAGLLTTDQPWYCNDNTMIQAVAYWTSYYHDGPDTKKTVKFGEDLATMLRDDKVKFGIINPPSTGLSRRFAGK